MEEESERREQGGGRGVRERPRAQRARRQARQRGRQLARRHHADRDAPAAGAALGRSRRTGCAPPGAAITAAASIISWWLRAVHPAAAGSRCWRDPSAAASRRPSCGWGRTHRGAPPEQLRSLNEEVNRKRMSVFGVFRHVSCWCVCVSCFDLRSHISLIFLPSPTLDRQVTVLYGGGRVNVTTKVGIDRLLPISCPGIVIMPVLPPCTARMR